MGRRHRTGRKNVLDTASLFVPLIPADERGFLGVAFHPGYAANGLVYTMTSEPIAGTASTPDQQPNHLATNGVEGPAAAQRPADPPRADPGVQPDRPPDPRTAVQPQRRGTVLRDPAGGPRPPVHHLGRRRLRRRPETASRPGR